LCRRVKLFVILSLDSLSVFYQNMPIPLCQFSIAILAIYKGF